jgi:hypothetical protein
MKRTSVNKPECYGEWLKDDPECSICAMNFSCGVKQIEIMYNLSENGF